MKTVADLYIRVSTEEQKLIGFSQRYQEEILKAYCTVHDLTIDQIVFEDHSAKTFNRPAWNKLFTGYRTHKFTIPRLLLVTKWDRFSRNTGDAYYMINYLSRIGIEVKAIEQPLDLSIPENKMMMAFFLSIPEVENARRSLNIKEGITRAKKEGRWIGSAPVGYRNKISESGLKYIQVVEPQAGIMRQAFQKIAIGIYSIKEIYTDALNNGLQRSYNCFWKALRNPVYCGLIKLNSSHSSDKLYAIGQHEPLITESLFENVQKILSKKKRQYKRSKNNDTFPFRRLLICPKCGRNLTGSSSKGKSRKYHYYHCISKCGFRAPVDKIHSFIKVLLDSLALLPCFKPLFSVVLSFCVKGNIDQNLMNNRKLIKKIEVLIARLDRAKDLLLEGTLSPKEYKTIRADYESKITILGEALENTTKENESIVLTISSATERITNLLTLFDSCSINEKKEILNHLFPYGITCENNGICIDNFSSSLWCVYFEQNAPGDISISLNELEEKFLTEPAQIKEEVRTLIKKLKVFSVRQCNDIITYFRKLSQIILNQAIERKSFHH